MNNKIKESKFYTVKDLKEAIKHMEKEDKLPLTGNILVSFKDNDNEYGVVSIGHYSIVPDLTLEVEEMEYE